MEIYCTEKQFLNSFRYFRYSYNIINKKKSKKIKALSSSGLNKLKYIDLIDFWGYKYFEYEFLQTNYDFAVFI